MVVNENFERDAAEARRIATPIREDVLKRLARVDPRLRETALTLVVMDLMEHAINEAPFPHVTPVAATIVARVFQLCGDLMVGADAVLAQTHEAMRRFYGLRRLRDEAKKQ